MPYIKINERIKPNVNAQTMKLFNEFYTESQFDLIKDIFCTYYNRDGILRFAQFAMIPIKKDPGDITNERGEWTKFIRSKLAHEWDDIIKHQLPNGNVKG